MPWYGWLSLAISLAGCMWALRVIAWAVASNFGDRDLDDLDGEGIALGLLLGVIACWTWPAIMAFLALRRTYEARPDAWVAVLISKPREPRSVRRERDLAERERRITRMERELGIR